MSWDSSDRRRRLPRNWRAIRRFVMDRDGWRCQWLVGGRVCGAQATEVHHIVEGGRNGGVEDDRPVNLMAICARHHKLATAAYARERRRARAEEPHWKGHPGVVG